MKRPDDGGVLAVVVATGIASVAVQLVCVRECLAQFAGNEIVIALILFCWLVCGGMGTAAATWRGLRQHPPSPRGLIRLSWLLVLLAPMQVLAIRWLRDLAFIHGASVGFFATFGFIAATLSPYALLIGYVLPYSLMVIRHRVPDYSGTRIYMADNAGDVAGGALFSLVLVYWLSPFQLLLAVHLPLLAALWRMDAPGRRRRLAVGLVIAALLAVAAAGEERLLPRREGVRLHYDEGRYGRIEVLASGDQVSLFSDGVPGHVSHHPALVEERVHFPLSQLERVGTVLLVSADGGTLDQVARYRPHRVDYVELDPLAARLKRRFGLVTPVDGLTVVNLDARTFLARTGTRYDAVVVNLPEPDTYQLNRFYTREFFDLVKSRLVPGGVFSFGIDGVDNYLSVNRQQKISVLTATARTVFSHVMLLPGQRLLFICRDRPIRTDIPALLDRRGIPTEHIHRYFHGDLTADRIQRVNAAADPSADLNTDLRPRLMRLAFGQWYARHGESPRWFTGLVGLLAAVLVIRLSRPQWVLMTTGCVHMGAEIVAIFAFQVFFGYIYLYIGVMVTVFLAGLLPGAWLGGRYGGSRIRALMGVDLALCLLLILLAGCLATVRQDLPAAVLVGFGLAVSLCCGFQLPVALTLLGDSRRAVAGLFSADLVGAAIGCLLVSLLLIPFMGLLRATVCLAAIKLASAFNSGTLHDPA